jgi:hypothetical protein
VVKQGGGGLGRLGVAYQDFKNGVMRNCVHVVQLAFVGGLFVNVEFFDCVHHGAFVYVL